MSHGIHANGTTSSVPTDAAIHNDHGPEFDPGHDLFWDSLPPAVVTALEQPLDPGLVSQRKGRAGKTYDYLEGHVVIDQANRIFGYGGWGYELAGDVTLRPIEIVDPATGEVTRTHAYSAPVRVTVPGAPPRTDVGFHPVAEATVDGHETACKGAVTDGLKRALRSFGDRFGNGLYGISATGAGQRTPSVTNSPRPVAVGARGGGPAGPAPVDRPDKSSARTLRTRLVELGAAQGFDEAQVHAAVQRRTGRALDDLSAAEVTTLVEAADRKLRQTRLAPAA